MNKLTSKLLTILCTALLLSACDTDISPSVDNFEPSAGDADFSTFVTVGDSLTAGYKDSALYLEGQENSFGAILAKQFAQVGGGAFRQPLMDPDATGSLYVVNPAAPLPGVNDRLVFAASGNPERPVTPVTIDPVVGTDIFTPLTGAFNNLGVPGAKSFHLTVPTYGDLAGLGTTANPFYIRFRQDPAQPVIVDAADPAPTFFVLWIGNNDILLYATAGAPGTANPPYGTASTEVTDPATFAAVYPGLVAGLKTPTNKGILINIPDVSTIPYFTTVPYDVIELDAATAAAVQAGYDATYNAAIAASPLPQAEKDQRTLRFSEGFNPLVIEDESLTTLGGGIPNIRQATAMDLIVLPASTKIGTEQTPGNPNTVWGVGTALEDGDVLTEFEIGLIEIARSDPGGYNETIANAAAADPDILLLDADALLQELNDTGISYGSGGISAVFFQGGGFSADGVHPTARGYAVIANEIIKVINDGFNANVAPVDPNQYSTVFYQK